MNWFGLIIILISLLSLSSCGEKKGDSSETSFSLSMNAGGNSDGGVFLLARNYDEFDFIQEEFRLDLITPEKSADFARGRWEFWLVSYEGPAIWQGTKSCGKSPRVNLDSPTRQIDIFVNQANCSQQIYQDLISLKSTQAGLGPVISSISPSSGPLGGGTSITINGDRFFNGLTVDIDGTPCVSVVVVDINTITCTTPSNGPGSVDILVTNPDLQSDVLIDGFDYSSGPSITSVTPPNGPPGGGTIINLAGSGFVNGATITVGGNACSPVTFTDANNISCTTSSNSSGSYDVVITNPDTQSDTETNGFTYNGAPTVTTVSPNSGPLAGGTSITISGTNFFAGATVDIGGTACTSVSVVNASTITCTTQPTAGGAYAVTVTNTDTQSGNLGSAYSFANVAVVTMTESDTYNFGTMAAGNTLSHTFTLNNSGSATATGLSDSLSTGFRFVGGSFPGTGGTCGGGIVAGGSCDIVVEAFETTAGVSNGSITINYNNGVSADSVTRLVSATVNPGTLNQIVFNTQPDDSAVGAELTPVLHLQDVFGNLITSATDTVTISIQSGSGSLTGTVSKAAVAGVADFTGNGMSIAGSGPFTIRATAGAVNVDSTSFNMLAPANVSISDGPSYDFGTINADVGTSTYLFTLTNSGSVNATGLSESGLAAPFTIKGGAWPGTGGDCGTSMTPGSNCNIAVEFASTTAGAYNDTINISYNDGVNVVNTTRNISGTIGHGAYTQIVFATEPSDNTAIGSTLGPVVELQDAYGNRCLTCTNTVTLSLVSGTGTLTGTSVLAAVAGVANFTVVSVDTAGAKTLQASASPHTGNSASFTMVAGPGSYGWSALGNGGDGAMGNRYAFTSVWTGTEFIIWGGSAGTNTTLCSNTGKKYNPSTGVWTDMTTTGAPTGRCRHTAVWDDVNDVMIIWGGYTKDADTGGSNLGDGYKYDPALDTWTAITNTNAPAMRHSHAAAIDGNARMLIYGGQNASSPAYSDGAIYNSSTDTWSAISATNEPTARSGSLMVWTGTDFFVWGGYSGGSVANGGALYDPDTDSWTASTNTNAPLNRRNFAWGWTGSEVVVFGGYTGAARIITGGVYDPALDTWTPTSITNTPSARNFVSGTANATHFFVFGGIDNTPTRMNDGGVYEIATDTWTSWSGTNATGAPGQRRSPMMEWAPTINKAVIFGGFDTSAVNGGGHFGP